jgi:hypothetical protein
LAAPLRRERVEIGNDRIGQQEQVSLHELLLAEYRPTRSTTAEQGLIAAGARIVYTTVDSGFMEQRILGGLLFHTMCHHRQNSPT